MSKRTRALLLAAHGSSVEPGSSAPIYAHAARIRARRLFHEVRVAFWKERPWLRDARREIESDDIFVVPMFMAEGYYTCQVLPREVGRHARIHYCRAVGSHPCMPQLVLKRARSVPVDQSRSALVVIGHGTDRSTTSSQTVERVTKRLRAGSGYAAVACGFLDQQPRIEAVVADLDASQVVLVPFFIAEGWHTRETIPQRLGLAGARTEQDGRVLWYTAPVGTLPEIAWAAADVARSYRTRTRS
ncbi:MAG: CbiX/SirB N-terminal domain-containing protein [Gemmatimonadota bacterium]